MSWKLSEIEKMNQIEEKRSRSAEEADFGGGKGQEAASGERKYQMIVMMVMVMMMLMMAMRMMR